MKTLIAALSVAAALGAAQSAAAGVIIQPKSVTVDIGGELLNFPAINMINQSGLTTKYLSGVTDFATYMASNPIHSASQGEWLSTGPTSTAKITFDFGTEIEFTGFAIWAEDASSLRSIIAGTPGGGNYGGFQFIDAPVGAAYGPTVKSHQRIKNRYVTFSLSGCNAAGFAHNGCGIGEVAFNSTGAPPVGVVPEPATWAMMIMGFGGVGATLRRRRHALA